MIPLGAKSKNPIIKSFLSLGSLRLASLPLSLASSILLARILGVDSYGQFSFIMAIVPLLSLPLAAGVPQLLTREIALYVQQSLWGHYRGLVRASYIWIAAISIVLIFSYIAATSFDLIPSHGKWALLPFGLLLVPLSGLNAVRNGVMRGLKSPFLASLPDMFLQPALFLVLAVGLYLGSTLNAASAISAQVAAALFSLLVANHLLSRIQPHNVSNAIPEFEPKPWLRALLPFTLIYVISSLNTNIGIVLLGFMGSDADVAAMRIAERISILVALPLQLSNLVISPYIANAWKSQDKVELQRISLQSARGTLALSAPLALLFIALGRPLIELVYGQEYGTLASKPLMILAAAQLMNVAFGSVGILLSMSGHERHTLRGQAGALLFSVGASVLLIPHYGATGAALGVATGLLVWNVMLATSVYKHLGIRPTAI